MFNIQVIRKGNRIIPPSVYQSLLTNGAVGNGYATITSIAAYGSFFDFTFEFWIKRAAWNSANARLIDFNYFAGWTMNRSGSTDKLSMGGVNSSVVISNSDLVQDTWTHLAFVRSGSTGLIYFNGTLDNSGGVGSASFPYTANPTFGLGADVSDNPGGNLQTLYMTDLRFWKEARSQAQISSNMNTHLVGNETNLIGNWQFLNGSLADSTATANTMNLQAAATVAAVSPY